MCQRCTLLLRHTCLSTAGAVTDGLLGPPGRRHQAEHVPSGRTLEGSLAPRASATPCPTPGPRQGERDPGGQMPCISSGLVVAPASGAHPRQALPAQRADPSSEPARPLGPSDQLGPRAPPSSSRPALLSPPPRPAASSALGWAVPRAPRPGGGTVRPSRPDPVIDQQRLLSLLMVRLGGKNNALRFT